MEKQKIYVGVVLGFVFDSSVLFKKDRVRNCEHPIQETFKFCPECGAESWKEVNIQLLNYGESYRTFDMFGIDDESGVSYVVVGKNIATGKTEQEALIDSISLSNIQKFNLEKMAEELSWLGFEVDENDFGLHLVSYVPRSIECLNNELRTYIKTNYSICFK